MIGLAASTYYYFAEHNGKLMESFQGKEGSIGGDNVTNVNLPSEPARKHTGYNACGNARARARRSRQVVEDKSAELGRHSACECA